MSMHGMVVPKNTVVPWLMTLLRIRAGEVPRFRDATMVRSSTEGLRYEIHVLVRVNVDDLEDGYAEWAPQINALRQHDTFLGDSTLPQDNTYSTLRFGVSQSMEDDVPDLMEQTNANAVLEDLGEITNWKTPGERFAEALNAVVGVAG